MADGTEFDVAFVGGGLASVLAASLLLERQPSLRLLLVERDAKLGGNHTWCFHAADLPRAAARVISPLIVHGWDGYTVRFPTRTRRLASPYACITSERLDQVATARLRDAPHSTLIMGHAVQELRERELVLDDGRRFRAPLVIAATGPEQTVARGGRGYQKFFGMELDAPGHGLVEPVVFDACLPQRDGFRFMYLLPLAHDRLLVEETFFSETHSLDERLSRQEILAYCSARGIHVRGVQRTERGLLPMPWIDQDFDASARPLLAGYRAGLFHPVTGYSFPLAVRFALALADSDLGKLAREPEGESPLSEFARAQASQRPFLRLLTRLLFTCFEPAQRYNVLEHFYRLKEPLIERFYAAELTPLDRARIFLGAPPRGFSVGRAWRAQREAS
ncbi:MAG TPA: lycopene beta-cyclase CrtY [Polyangiales bacterium]|nr:lycopene beta-cyclase CrtY [Polyangiales bacterium]